MEETATIKFDLKRVRKTGVHTHRAPFAELLLKPVLLSLLHGSLSRLRQKFSSPATSPPPSQPIQRGILSFLTIPLSPLLPLTAPHSPLPTRPTSLAIFSRLNSYRVQRNGREKDGDRKQFRRRPLSNY